MQTIFKIVTKHYKKEKGVLSLWGKTENYVYHQNEKEIYIFNTEGILIQDVEVAESIATLRLR
jgi:hypothetical protein